MTSKTIYPLQGALRTAPDVRGDGPCTSGALPQKAGGPSFFSDECHAQTLR